MAQAKMSILYDKKHRPPDLTDKVYLKMVKTEQSNYHIPESSSLITKKLKPFFVKKKIENLIYELKLLTFMKINFVIFVIHLKQAKKNELFERDSAFHIVDSKSIVVNENDQYVIKKIMRAEMKNEESDYIVKWKKYEKKI